MLKEGERFEMYEIEVPSHDGFNWHFEFELVFGKPRPLGVVVRWHETSIGCGEMALVDCSECWQQNFKAYTHIHTIAINTAFQWNVFPDRPASRCS